PERALADFRAARSITLGLVRGLTEAQLERHGTFAEYGSLTLRSLLHYLASHDRQHLACMEWLLGKIHAR
ncbi:MAG: DinB family protein, partial [Thermoanaerobaculia bacterium]